MNRRFTIATYVGSAFLLIAFLTACASSGPRIVTNSDPRANWNQYRTFGFFPQLGTDRGSVRSLASSQLIESTTRQMELAGYRFTESQPDLLINFVISTRETLQSRPSTGVGVSHGRGRYGTWSGWNMSTSTAQVVQRTEGTLAIDIVDRVRNQLVWEGAATKVVPSGATATQPAVLDAKVAELFRSFP